MHGCKLGVAYARAHTLTIVQAAPLFTKQCTSLIGYGLGDTMAQLATTGTVNPLRVAKLASFGFLVDAPCAHQFYSASIACSCGC